MIDRLGHQPDAFAPALGRRVAQIGHHGASRGGGVNAFRAPSGEAVHAIAAQRLCVANRLGDPVPEFSLAPRQTGETPFALIPIPGR